MDPQTPATRRRRQSWAPRKPHWPDSRHRAVLFPERRAVLLSLLLLPLLVLSLLLLILLLLLLVLFPERRGGACERGRGSASPGLPIRPISSFNAVKLHEISGHPETQRLLDKEHLGGETSRARANMSV